MEVVNERLRKILSSLNQARDRRDNAQPLGRIYLLLQVVFRKTWQPGHDVSCSLSSEIVLHLFITHLWTDCV